MKRRGERKRPPAAPRGIIYDTQRFCRVGVQREVGNFEVVIITGFWYGKASRCCKIEII